MNVTPKLVIGNWKMNGLREASLQLATAVAEGARSLPDDVRMVICPPFTQLDRVAEALEGAGASIML